MISHQRFEALLPLLLLLSLLLLVLLLLLLLLLLAGPEFVPILPPTAPAVVR